MTLTVNSCGIPTLLGRGRKREVEGGMGEEGEEGGREGEGVKRREEEGEGQKKRGREERIAEKTLNKHKHSFRAANMACKIFGCVS